MKKEEKSWHYLRKCKNCGNEWYGLHCVHDGVQNPCPKCNTRPLKQIGECNCEFDDYKKDEVGAEIPHLTSWKEQFIWLNEEHQKLKQKLADKQKEFSIAKTALNIKLGAFSSMADRIKLMLLKQAELEVEVADKQKEIKKHMLEVHRLSCIVESYELEDMDFKQRFADKEKELEELNKKTKMWERSYEYVRIENEKLRSKIKELGFCNCGDSTENKPKCDTCVMTDEDDIKEQKELECKNIIEQKIKDLKNPYPKDIFRWDNKEKLNFNRGRFNQHCFNVWECCEEDLKKLLLEKSFIFSTVGNVRSGMTIPALHMSRRREDWFEFLKSIEWGVTASCNAKWKGRIKQTIGELDDIFNWFDMLPQAYDEGLTDIGKGDKTLTMIFEKAQRWNDLKKGLLDCSEKDNKESKSIILGGDVWTEKSCIDCSKTFTGKGFMTRCSPCQNKLLIKQHKTESEKPSGMSIEKWTAKKIKDDWIDDMECFMNFGNSEQFIKLADLRKVIDEEYDYWKNRQHRKVDGKRVAEVLGFIKQKIFGDGKKVMT